MLLTTLAKFSWLNILLTPIVILVTTLPFCVLLFKIPKKNSKLGYHSKTAKSSDKAWQYANMWSPVWVLVMASICLIIHAIIMFSVKQSQVPDWYSYVSLIIYIVLFILTIVVFEFYLRSKFKIIEENNKKDEEKPSETDKE